MPRKSSASPLSRSFVVLKAEGFDFDKTEMPWNRFSKVRHDFCNFGDAVAFKPGFGTLAINATTNSHLSDHLLKYKTNKKLENWLKTGNFFEIWCWSKMGARGKRKTWTLKRVPVALALFEIPDGEIINMENS